MGRRAGTRPREAWDWVARPRVTYYLCGVSAQSAKVGRTMRVTVLGAGYMGSAMARVAQRRGHEVRLWGTWLDDAMLDPCERGEPHPRLKLALDGIALFRARAAARRRSRAPSSSSTP